ncbi:hypothetical protein MBLNU459_g4017t1 [Dothideomycetes sp. NU459]
MANIAIPLTSFDHAERRGEDQTEWNLLSFRPQSCLNGLRLTIIVSHLMENLSMDSADNLSLHVFSFVSDFTRYNSVVYSTLSATDYVSVLVTEDFVNQGWWNSTDLNINTLGLINASSIQYLQANASRLTKLNNADCIERYGTSMIESNWGDVLVVTNLERNDSSIYAWQHTPESGGYNDEEWVCSGGRDYTGMGCDTQSLISHADNWTLSRPSFCDRPLYNYTDEGICAVAPFVAPVQYCLAREVMPHCTVSISVTLMGAVIASNLAKILCLVCTLFAFHFHPLATVGDAIASFLERPDPTTARHGPLSALDVRKGQWRNEKDRKQDRASQGLELSDFSLLLNDAAQMQRGHQPDSQCLSPASMIPPRPWQSKSYRWFRSASTWRWIICILLCLIVWLTGLGLAVQGNEGNSISEIFAAGVGSADSSNILGTHTGDSVIANVLTANAFQLTVSFLYIFYNNLFTCMLLGYEYTKFASNRKSLRVTKPAGQQRSTYWLQLPYRYSVPLMFAVGSLHWMIARSIFLLEVNFYNSSDDNYGSLSTCGYSPAAIIVSLIIGGVLIIALIINGFRKLNPGMPIAASNSVAISAACHRPAGDLEAALMPIKYGVVAGGLRLTNGDEMLEHVCFTSEETEELVSSRVYI